MKRMLRIAGINLFFIFFLFYLVSAQESITITTYYPSPYGSYNELSVASNTYLATSSGNVGIGTTSPGAKLVVMDGYVGIGTTAPSKHLEVRENHNGSTSIIVQNNTAGTTAKSSICFGEAITGGIYGYLGYNNLGWAQTNTFDEPRSMQVGGGYLTELNLVTMNGRNIKFFTGESSGGTQYAPPERMRISSTGNVGIGTTVPSSKLDVSGGTITLDQTDNGTSGTATTINWTTSNKQKLNLTGNCTLTFTAPGGPCNLVLVLVQDSTGNRSVTWPATVKWPGGTAPTLSITANAVDIVSFYYNGTNYYSQASLNFQ